MMSIRAQQRLSSLGEIVAASSNPEIKTMHAHLHGLVGGETKYAGGKIDETLSW
jgi:hypothetical protein